MEYKNIQTKDLLEFFDAGQRSFRLKRSISDCPDFKEEIYCKAWKSGFRLALRHFGLRDGFQQFLYQIDKD
jgi:hypothetical protein